MQWFWGASLLPASHCPFETLPCSGAACLPAISKPNSNGKDCEYTPRKDVTFFPNASFQFGKRNILCRRANDRYRQFIAGRCIVFRAKWRREYIENGNLVKNKDGDSSFLPELQRRQNDNMAIPEKQYAVLWTLQRHTVVFGKPINRYHTPPKLIFFRVKSGFYVHGSRRNAGGRVFECPRTKRGAPDLRVIQAARPGSWSRWPTNPSVTAKRAQLCFKGNRWLEMLSVYV